MDNVRFMKKLNTPFASGNLAKIILKAVNGY